MRDLTPPEAAGLSAILETCKKVFESYGFVPIDTPALEPFELFASKGGLGEGVRDEVYAFKDKSGRELALRFEFTASLARYVSNNQGMPRPFKRYQMGKVWRYDNPQALRYREFSQADIDIVGSSSPLADAECIAAACDCLLALGIKDFIVRVNSRKLLDEILEKRGIPKDKVADVFRTIDKLGKVSEENIAAELSQKEIDPKKVMDITRIKGSNTEVMTALSKVSGKSTAIDELQKLLEYAEMLGIEKSIKIDPSLVRGLDYYTSLVFEIAVGAGKVSFGGGGRYDNLMKSLGGPDLPATGISFGIDRLLEVAKPQLQRPPRVFVSSVSDAQQAKAVEIARKLRSAGLIAVVDLDGRKLSKQFEYADEISADWTVIVGEKELKSGNVKVRNMSSGDERDIPLADIHLWAKSIAGGK